MRVALFPSAYAPAVGGVEELTRQLALHLRSRGHTVEVWTNRHPANLPVYETIDGVVVRRFAMTLPAGSAQSLAAFVPGALRGVGEVARAVRDFRPDVIHVQCFSVNGVYAAAIAQLLRVPLIVTLQGETVMDDNDIYERSTSLRLGLRAGLRAARVVTGCSQFTLNDAVARFGLPPGRGVVVPNGVDLDEPARPEPLELPFYRFVLAMGRVVEKKGFDLLIDAFGQVASQVTDVGLVIGGEGAARPALMAQAETAGLSDRVLFPGRLGRGQVAWATREAAVFVLPSRVEPFGIVVLEAMSAGAPVVVSSRGGAREIVRDGIDGLVADPFDTDALAGALTRVLAEPALGMRLVASAKARVKEFDWDPITERYVDLYGEAGGRNGSTRA